MRKLVPLALAGAAIAAVMVPGTAGARQTFETSILPVTVSTVDSVRIVTGLVSSEKNKCVGNRKVKLLVGNPDNGLVLLDTDRSSENGAWAVQAAIDEYFGITRVKLAKADVGNDTCGGDAEDVKP